MLSSKTVGKGKNRANKKLTGIFLALLLFAAAIALISKVYRNNTLLTAALAIAAFAVLKYIYSGKQYIRAFLTGFLIGPVGEAVAIHFGAWQYTNPTAFGMPLWLPIVWGLASVLVYRITETLSSVS